jgi:hypothetical protein
MIRDTLKRRLEHEKKLESLIINAEKNSGEYYKNFMLERKKKYLTCECTVSGIECQSSVEYDFYGKNSNVS